MRDRTQAHDDENMNSHDEGPADRCKDCRKTFPTSSLNYEGPPLCLRCVNAREARRVAFDMSYYGSREFQEDIGS